MRWVKSTYNECIINTPEARMDHGSRGSDRVCPSDVGGLPLLRMEAALLTQTSEPKGTT